jgi:CBS domain containing-hemolysin-like protein
VIKGTKFELITTMAVPVYIISRAMDPIFAIFIGTSAAVLRISREEKEKGRSKDDTINAALR